MFPLSESVSAFAFASEHQRVDSIGEHVGIGRSGQLRHIMPPLVQFGTEMAADEAITAENEDIHCLSANGCKDGALPGRPDGQSVGQASPDPLFGGSSEVLVDYGVRYRHPGILLRSDRTPKCMCWGCKEASECDGSLVNVTDIRERIRDRISDRDPVGRIGEIPAAAASRVKALTI